MPPGHDQDVYIPVEQVAERLKVSTRQASRYGSKLRTQRAGRRVLYHQGDVEQLAEELGAEHRVPPPQPRTELVPLGEMLQHQRQREIDHDRQVDDLSKQLQQAAKRVGELEAKLEKAEQRPLLEDHEALRTERDRLAAEVERSRSRSWWRRLLDI